MKTAVSLPNDLFAAAEQLAVRLGTSRSAVYAAALRESLARHEPRALSAWVARYNAAQADGELEARARPAAEHLRRVEGVTAIRQGGVWWADVARPLGSEPGFRRLLLVVQADRFTEAGLATVVAVPLSSNLTLASHASCVEVPAAVTGLPEDAVALVHQIHAVDRARLVAAAGQVSPPLLERILAALDLVLGR